MTTQSGHRRRFGPALLGLAMFAAIVVLTAQSCGGQPDFDVKDLKQEQGQSTTQTYTVPSNSVPQPQDMNMDFSVTKQFQHNIDINLASGSNIDEGKVRDKVYNLYKIPTSKISDSKICVIPVSIPAGHVYQYQVEWDEVVRDGTITETGNGSTLGSYTLVEDLLCQVTGLNDVTHGAVPNTAGPSADNQPAPQPVTTVLAPS